MRIISGKYKGRALNPPKNLKARPTTDVAKEALFDILNNRIDFEETKVLDMFGGTGSISLEFASRGCPNVTLLEMNAINYGFIKKTISDLKATEINAIKGDSFKYVEKCGSKFDMVFADPPYDHPRLKEIPDLIFQNDLLNDEGVLILEHPKEFSFESHPNFLEHRKYGHVNFTFFQKASE